MNQTNLSSHDEIFLLLPWYVNRTLDANEQTAVSSHIDECTICRREIEYLTHVDSVAKDQDDVHAIARNGFARILQRIDHNDAGPDRSHSRNAKIGEKVYDWLHLGWLWPRGVIIAVPAILMLVIAGKSLWPTSSPHDPAYQTLTSDNPVNNEALQFKVTLMENTESAVLQSYFREMWGTTATIEKSQDGSYLFELPLDASPGKVTELLNRLKKHEDIKSVELNVD